ncbi:HK97 family phage prohead protease [Pseudorhodoferax sp. Leaf267]|uniref:HK97 family phage prohead protease n=1 Tax=Pseudorhodoferax sp. Leaf267 TaxID=1736316 RepID=UPI00138EF540|nr:peptidase U35 [Pseudorhodoferax sp. Leaf267]
MNRAYSVVEVKRMSEQSDTVTIEGIASTPTVDKAGDVVIPTGAKFSLPMPLLLSHKHDMPVGKVVYACPTARGIPFTARLPRIKSPGVLKSRVDEAIDSLQSGLIAACSVGFTAISSRTKRLPGGGTEYSEWSWHELSLCTVPMNSEAVITSVKAMGPASTAAHLSPELIHQIKLANFRASRVGVPLVGLAPRTGVKLLDARR